MRKRVFVNLTQKDFPCLYIKRRRTSLVGSYYDFFNYSHDKVVRQHYNLVRR